MVTRWVLSDPATGDSYQFEINPNVGGTPARKKTVTVSPTCAWNGTNVLFQGRDDPQEIVFSGIILSDAMLGSLIDWWKKQRQVQLTDDLGRSYWIYLSEFSPSPVRASTNLEKYKFDCKATVLDWS